MVRALRLDMMLLPDNGRVGEPRDILTTSRPLCIAISLAGRLSLSARHNHPFAGFSVWPSTDPADRHTPYPRSFTCS